MISQALLVGNFEAAVDICVEADRMVRGFCGNKSIDIVLVGWSISISHSWWHWTCFQNITNILPKSDFTIIQGNCIIMWLLLCHCHPVTVSQLLSAIVNRTWSELARHGNLQNWREILAVLVTYAGPEDFATLCGKLTVYYINHILWAWRIDVTLYCSPDRFTGWKNGDKAQWTVSR